MKRKYQLKKKRKLVSTSGILITVILISLGLSVGYSFFSTQFNIIGNVNLSGVPPYVEYDEVSKSVATWEIVQQPWNRDGVYYYKIEINLQNLDKNFDNWTLDLYYPPYVVEDKMEFWGSATGEVLRIENYDVVRFTSQFWNGRVNLNDTLNISFIMAYSGNLTLVTDHLVFNGLLVKDFTQIGEKYVVGNSTGDHGDPTGGETGDETGDDLDPSNSTLSYRVKNTWQSGNYTVNQLQINFTNRDSNTSSWKLSLDFDNNIPDNGVNQWISPDTQILDVGGYRRVKLHNFDYNGMLNNGNTLSFEMQVMTPIGETPNIINVVFNNMKVTDITKR